MIWISAALAILGCVSAMNVPQPTTMCYQCAYSKDDMLVETIEVPREVIDEIETPRTVWEEQEFTFIEMENVTVTEVVIDTIEVPRIVEEEVEKPSVVEITKNVSRLVKDPSDDSDNPITRIEFEEVTQTMLDFEPMVVTKTEIDLEEVSRLVEEVKQMPRTVTEIRNVSRIVIDIEEVSRIVFDLQNITKMTKGGWDKCLGPFNKEEAQDAGIDILDCHGNCYTRIEGDNMYRGCYRGEYGVDQTLYGCHEQSGAVWCLCKGSLCNNKAQMAELEEEQEQ